jgi:hypothetical protein
MVFYRFLCRFFFIFCEDVVAVHELLGFGVEGDLFGGEGAVVGEV